MKNLSQQQLNQLAKKNPYLDLNLLRQWQRQKEELERLGVDFSHPHQRQDSPPTAPKNRQSIAGKFLRFPFGNN